MKLRICFILLTLSLYGCATTSSPEQAAQFAEEPLITDPFEPFNRSMYNFNKVLDTILVKPVAEGYVAVVPATARESVDNFFGNIEEVSVFVNTILQGRFEDAGITATRFAINSTIGIFGLFDVAEKWGMPEKQGDFGQTFYTWGIKRTAYLVLPVLGPTTGREGVGKVPGYFFSVWDLTEFEVQVAAFGLMAIDLRSQYLNQEEILANAFDEYTLVRDIYIQQRETFLKGTQDVTDWDEDLINEHEVY